MMSAPSGMGWYVFDVNTSQQCDFQVISINGFESLGKPYSFDVELVSESYDLDLSKIIGCPATLTIQPPWGSTASFYHGIITQIQSLKVTNQGMMHYRVLMEPRYSRLKQTKLNYIYTNTIKGYALSDLITEVLNRQALTSGTDYQFSSLAPIMTRDFLMQYEETDFNFLQRWIEYEGACYYFIQEATAEKICFVDDVESIPGKTYQLRYTPPGMFGVDQYTSSLLNLDSVQNLAIKNWEVDDYNYEKAQDLVVGNQTNSEALWGNHYIFGGGLKANDVAKKYAKLRGEASMTQFFTAHGTTYVSGIEPGDKVRVTEHPRKSLNTEYRVVSVRHLGSQGGFGLSTPEVDSDQKALANYYTAEIELIPIHTPFRLPLGAPVPKIAGYMPALVDAEGDGKVPELDKYGRYKVKFPFGFNSYDPGKASAWVRFASPFNGIGQFGNAGFHFPLLKGSEVLLVFEDGNPDLPTIAGAVSNSLAPNTVTDHNPTLNRIVSYTGNQMHLDDTANTGGIRLLSSNGALFTIGAFGGKIGTSSDDSSEN